MKNWVKLPNGELINTGILLEVCVDNYRSTPSHTWYGINGSGCVSFLEQEDGEALIKYLEEFAYVCPKKRIVSGRSPERIPEVLRRLQEVWERYPDMRLGQLLVNVFNDNDFFYIEDAAFVDRVEKFYSKPNS